MEQLGTKRSLTPNNLENKRNSGFLQTDDLENVDFIINNDLIEDRQQSNETLENDDIDERIIFPKDSPTRNGKSYPMAETYQQNAPRRAYHNLNMLKMPPISLIMP
jgi:hypothetical protein